MRNLKKNFSFFSPASSQKRVYKAIGLLALVVLGIIFLTLIDNERALAFYNFISFLALFWQLLSGDLTGLAFYSQLQKPLPEELTKLNYIFNSKPPTYNLNAKTFCFNPQRFFFELTKKHQNNKIVKVSFDYYNLFKGAPSTIEQLNLKKYPWYTSLEKAFVKVGAELKVQLPRWKAIELKKDIAHIELLHHKKARLVGKSLAVISSLKILFLIFLIVIIIVFLARIFYAFFVEGKKLSFKNWNQPTTKKEVIILVPSSDKEPYQYLKLFIKYIKPSLVLKLFGVLSLMLVFYGIILISGIFQLHNLIETSCFSLLENIMNVSNIPYVKTQDIQHYIYNLMKISTNPSKPLPLQKFWYFFAPFSLIAGSVLVYFGFPYVKTALKYVFAPLAFVLKWFKPKDGGDQPPNPQASSSVPETTGTQPNDAAAPQASSSLPDTTGTQPNDAADTRVTISSFVTEQSRILNTQVSNVGLASNEEMVKAWEDTLTNTSLAKIYYDPVTAKAANLWTMVERSLENEVISGFLDLSNVTLPSKLNDYLLAVIKYIIHRIRYTFMLEDGGGGNKEQSVEILCAFAVYDKQQKQEQEKQEQEKQEQEKQEQEKT